ncbi:phosphorylase family protein, partial [Leucobacter sp. M11]|uniref:phosphorylase family protein n=1 Tax=Leucobacter sp. M11 TaxID=2993565 RepID=UPI002D8072AC
DGPDRPSLDEVVQITGVVQHDFSLPSPTLVPEGALLLPERTATIATGDVFVKDDAQRAHIASLGASLVDMEGYAYASVCARFGVGLQLFKIPSDFADSSTTDAEWDTIVFRKSEQLRAFWDTRLAPTAA